MNPHENFHPLNNHSRGFDLFLFTPRNSFNDTQKGKIFFFLERRIGREFTRNCVRRRRFKEFGINRIIIAWESEILWARVCRCVRLFFYKLKYNAQLLLLGSWRKMHGKTNGKILNVENFANFIQSFFIRFEIERENMF